jgi:HK97 family phage prohead protease
LEKSFSSITIKAFDEEKRELEGMASTPAVDRVGDIVEPLGLTFQKDAPLLLNHDHAQPVGTVTFGEPTLRGLPFKAKIAKVSTPGVVKQRTDEAWDSVKSGIIKSVSIGFRARASKALSNGGTHFTAADVHELSLVSVPANPQATITAFKSIQLTPTINKENNLNTKHAENIIKFIRPVIANGVCVQQPGSAAAYAKARWGEHSEVAKSLVATVDGSALINQRIYADAFVEAVFSASILGKLHNLSQVPALTRIPVEINPIVAQFVEEGKSIPAQQGEFQVSVTESRKLAAITVVSEELLRVTDGVAERLIANMIVRSLSRGLDAVFVGDQVRDNAQPQGLANFAPQATDFEGGLASFAGDLANAAVIVNPITAVGLRSEVEQDITAAGGTYKGFPVITSIGVPAGKLFIVDGSRVLAYLGSAEVIASTSAGITLNSGDTVPTALYGSGSVGIRALQYADWSFVPGAAVEVTLN